MKLSKYTYIIEKGEKTYWYNGISHCYFILEKKIGVKLNLMMKNDLSILQEKSPQFYNRLKENDFIVDDSINEIDIIKEKYNQTVEKKIYYLIILPTLNCNFKCWYCVQDHIESVMNDATISKVKKHIEKMIRDEEITSLHIEWFGGEPFLFFKEVIKPISEYAIRLCENFHIPFTNTSTTNGYYLRQSIHKELVNLNFSRFQITLDGKRSLHNTIKTAENGTSAFDITLSNINNLLSLSSNIRIQLRINYTEQTLDYDIIEQINSIIEPTNRHLVIVIFKKVWQENADKKRAERINDIVQKFREAGYNCSSTDLVRNFIPCYTERKWYNAINYNGDIHKCTASNLLYSDTPPGKLKEDGSILWQEHFLSDFHVPRFENNCVECKYLPICMGPCVLHYSAKSQNHVCTLKGLDLKFEDLIINLMETGNSINKNMT
jgi:uncharacterized protein